MANQEMIQEKIGEALGLEKAAQKALEQLDSRGLLKSEHMTKLSKMKDNRLNSQ
jgi:predicted transcriptional regulator